jgi:hypothetical protein
MKLKERLVWPEVARLEQRLQLFPAQDMQEAGDAGMQMATKCPQIHKSFFSVQNS